MKNEKLKLRDIIEIYKANDFKISELRLILEDTSKEYNDIKELEKAQVETKKLIDAELDNGHKVISEGWSFNKGTETVRKTINASAIKELYEGIKDGEYVILINGISHGFEPYKETKIAPRLTITPPKKMTYQEINKNTKENKVVEFEV